MELTRFGALWAPPEVACRPLRALAARHGVSLAPVTDVDAAAAVLAVDAWMLLVGASRLSDPYRYGEPAVRVLSAALSRAAGAAPACVSEVQVEGVRLTSHPTDLERHVRMLPDRDRGEVVRRAASDLQVAADDPGTGGDLAGYGAALFLLGG